MLKFSDNPDILYPPTAAITELAGKWWVAHTKPRAEKAFAHDLADLNVAYFLPMIERTTFSGGRKRRGMLALFPSYVFINHVPHDVSDLRRNKHLVNLIAVPDQVMLVEELSGIHTLLAANVPLAHYPSIAAGTRVRIARGPFKDLLGTVVSAHGKTQFVLQVSLLGCGAAMEVDADLLERVE